MTNPPIPRNHLEAPLFIEAMAEETVNVAKTPFFYNDGGVPKYRSRPPAGIIPLTPATTKPRVAMGNEYGVSGVHRRQPRPPYGIETQLNFAAEQVEFAPMWATREVAAAFGMTLVEPGQAIKLSSPVALLKHVQYQYGVFAGHCSPYQGTGKTMLSVVCTDLEHHDFPHVFASTDLQQPLVISVGRYWPERGKIRLADLWVPRGSALYVPPMPESSAAECIDLHGNRNSAHACWGDIHQNSIVTRTLLQTDQPYFYWYWNAIATVHGKPLTGG